MRTVHYGSPGNKNVYIYTVNFQIRPYVLNSAANPDILLPIRSYTIKPIWPYNSHWEMHITALVDENIKCPLVNSQGPIRPSPPALTPGHSQLLHTAPLDPPLPLAIPVFYTEPH